MHSRLAGFVLMTPNQWTIHTDKGHLGDTTLVTNPRTCHSVQEQKERGKGGLPLIVYLIKACFNEILYDIDKQRNTIYCQSHQEREGGSQNFDNHKMVPSNLRPGNGGLRITHTQLIAQCGNYQYSHIT